jgi:DNA repair photolyase
VKRGWLRLVEKLFRKASMVEPRPWFRLSTLSDPLQESHKGLLFRATLRVLQLAERYHVPIVLNTKNSAIANPEVLGLLGSLADRGLIVVQVTLTPSGFDRLVEPRAPPVYSRLEALKQLLRYDIPVVARVQPLLPGLEEWSLRLAQDALARGAWALIGESLRETRRGLEALYKTMGLDYNAFSWEPYQLREETGREPLYHPSRDWRDTIHMSLKGITQSYAAHYSPCKDGWLYIYAPAWRPGKDSCGLWLAGTAEKGGSPPLYRPTLHEYAYYLHVLGGRGGWEGFVEWCQNELADKGYVCGQQLEKLPSWLRKPLRLHERRLRKLVERSEWIKIVGINSSGLHYRNE